MCLECGLVLPSISAWEVVGNGLEDVSTALWSVILSNPEKSGLAAIHLVAKEAILKGESR